MPGATHSPIAGLALTQLCLSSATGVLLTVCALCLRVIVSQALPPQRQFPV